MTRSKRQWICLALFLLAILVIGLLLYQFQSRLTQHEKLGLRTSLEEIRDNSGYILRAEMEQALALVDNEARTIELLNLTTDDALLRELQSYPREESMLRLNIFTQEGRFYSSNDAEPYQYDGVDNKYLFEDQGSHVSAPRYSDTFKKVVVEVSVPILVKGQDEGVLVGCYDLQFFEKLLVNNFLDGDCTIFIITSSGEQVSRSEQFNRHNYSGAEMHNAFENMPTVFSVGSPESMLFNMQKGRSGYVEYESEGLERYVSYAPAGVRDWYVLAVSTERALAAQTSVVNGYVLWLVVGVMLSILTMAVIILFIRAREHTQIKLFLQRTAQTDALTQLYNRAATEQRIKSFLQERQGAGNHALLMFDIDGFKHVNDHLGHMKGDEILADFGRLLLAIIPERAIVGRLGGDEFLALLPDYHDEDEICAVATAICRGFCKTHVDATDSTQWAKTSASIGISCYDSDGGSFRELYHCADIALYASKRAGRNRYTFYHQCSEESTVCASQEIINP